MVLIIKGPIRVIACGMVQEQACFFYSVLQLDVEYDQPVEALKSLQYDVLRV